LPTARTRAKTPKRQKYLLNVLESTFGHLRPVDVTRTICRAYEKARLDLGRKPHTIYSELNFVRTVINWAAKEDLIRVDEVSSVYVPPMPEPRDRHLSMDEVERLIDAADFPHVRLFLILALTTAARKTAILDLTWTRVDFERGLIYLHDPDKERTAKGRAIVPMNSTARAALLEAKAAAVTDHVVEWSGKRIANVKKGVSAAFVKSGLKVKGDGAHVLRHTAAVLMAESGVPMEEIAQYLGHADLRTTYRTYARFSPSYLQKAASALNLPAVRSSAR
jgi:integrase